MKHGVNLDSRLREAGGCLVRSLTTSCSLPGVLGKCGQR